MINQEHYRQIAEVAQRNGASFEALAERYENGLSIEQIMLTNGRNLLLPDEQWITLDQAAAIIGTTTFTFSAIAGLKGKDYYGIGTKSRSLKPGAGCRGAGRLVLRADIVELTRIKRAMGISLIMALRVFHAKFKGII